jgi:integrase
VSEIKKKDGGHYSPRRWRVCISYTVPELQEDGSVKNVRNKLQRNFTGTKTGAKELRDRLIAERDDDGRLLSSVEKEAEEAAKVEAMTLSKMIGMWDDARHTAGRASERTMREDRSRLARVEKYIGEQPISKINAQMVEQTYAAIREERHLSGTTMRHIHTLLKNVFQKAIDYDLIAKNPCDYVDAPKRNPANRRSLTQDEAARLHAEIDRAEEEAYEALGAKEERRAYREEHDIARDRGSMRGLRDVSNVIAVRIGLATGMRRGEVCALDWGDVDLESGTIRVGKSLTQKGVVKVPKTEAGWRNLAIGPEPAAHLARWKGRQAEELAKICVKQTEATPVVCTGIGGRTRVDNFEGWWAAWREEHGFPGLKFHELRHTQATQLLANGVDVKTVQTRMGHASPSITLAWYAHAIPGKDHEAAAMLDDLFASKGDETQERGHVPSPVPSAMETASETGPKQPQEVASSKSEGGN